MSKLIIPVWFKDDGSKVSCVEKIKVMNQNLQELEQILQDVYDDAILMGVNKKQIRDFLYHMVDSLKDNYN
jgi:hypothetical protein